MDIQFDPALKEILLRETGNPLGAEILPEQDIEIPVVIRLHKNMDLISKK